MSTEQNSVSQVIESHIVGMGYVFVGLEQIQQGSTPLLRIYVETNEGPINIDEIGQISHQLSAALDVIDLFKNQYTLEVSSPGIERPLFKLGDYERFAGEQVHIKLKRSIEQRKQWSGQLQGVEGEEVLIRVEENDKLIRCPLIDIKKARLVVQW